LKDRAEAKEVEKKILLKAQFELDEEKRKKEIIKKKVFEARD